ncbi:N-acetyltransferase ESCO1 isoform X2 [Callorhinchus milii]|nr:N-acetyltransferase ESCO1 isoform X2 [Callorhinchus milii]
MVKETERMSAVMKKSTKPSLKKSALQKSSHQKKNVDRTVSKMKVLPERKVTKRQCTGKAVSKGGSDKVSRTRLQSSRISQSQATRKDLRISKESSSKQTSKIASSKNCSKRKLTRNMNKQSQKKSLRTMENSCLRITTDTKKSKKTVKSKSDITKFKTEKKNVKPLSVIVKNIKKRAVKKTLKPVTSKSGLRKQSTSHNSSKNVVKFDEGTSEKLSEKTQHNVKSAKRTQQKRGTNSSVQPVTVKQELIETVKPQTRSSRGTLKEKIQQVVDSKLKSVTKQIQNKRQVRSSQRLNLTLPLSTRSTLPIGRKSSTIPHQTKSVKRKLSDLSSKHSEAVSPSEKNCNKSSKTGETKLYPKHGSKTKLEKVKQTPKEKVLKISCTKGAGKVEMEKASIPSVEKTSEGTEIDIEKKSSTLVSSQEHSETKVKRDASLQSDGQKLEEKGPVQKLAKVTSDNAKEKNGVKSMNKTINASGQKRVNHSLKQHLHPSKPSHKLKCKASKNKICPKKVVESPSLQTEDDAKCKRQSILELCEEIADEIASDTLDASVKTEPTKIENENVQKEPEAIIPEDVKKKTQSRVTFSSLKKFKFSGQKCAKRKLIEHNKCMNTRYSLQKGNSWTRIKQIKTDQKKINAIKTIQKLKNLELKQAVSQVVVQTVNKTIEKEKLPNGVPTETKEENGVTCEQNKSKNVSFRKELGKGTLNSKNISENSTPEKVKKLIELFYRKDEPEVPNVEAESEADESFRLHLESSPDCSPMKGVTTAPVKEKLESEVEVSAPMETIRALFSSPGSSERNNESVPLSSQLTEAKSIVVASDLSVQKEVKPVNDTERGGLQQLTIDAGQKRIGAVSCAICGMLYAASVPEDEAQHLQFHKRFISAVKYVGWKKERILSEYPDGKIIMVLPDDPKYALKKVEEIREIVDNDLGFQHAELKCPSRTKTLLFISNDRKVVGCLIAEHIQRGFKVIADKTSQESTNDAIMLESQRAWCCSTNAEPAICGISRVWVFNLMRRKAIATRMIDCLRSNFVYGSYLSKEEIAFSDPTADGKLFATQYCGTPRFLVYNFVS